MRFTQIKRPGPTVPQTRERLKVVEQNLRKRPNDSHLLLERLRLKVHLIGQHGQVAHTESALADLAAIYAADPDARGEPSLAQVNDWLLAHTPNASSGSPAVPTVERRVARDCPACGRACDLEADFCPACGHELPALDSADILPLVQDLSARIEALASRSQATSLPDSAIFSDSFLKRAFAVYGHVLVAGLIVVVPVYLLVFLFLTASR